MNNNMILFERITLHNLDKQIKHIRLRDKQAGLIVRKLPQGYIMSLSVHGEYIRDGRFNELEAIQIMDSCEPLILSRPSDVMEFAGANGISRHRIRFVQ